MLLRKINAGLGLLSTVLLMGHAIFLAAWMLSRGSFPNFDTPLPWILVWAVAAHAIISIVLAFLGHKGAEKRKCNFYPKLNPSTIVQRASGILLLLFTAPHIAGVTGVLQPSQPVHAILPPLFFAVSMAHVAVSTSKAFITLGIGNAEFIKTLDAVVKVVCVATLIADVAGFFLFLY